MTRTANPLARPIRAVALTIVPGSFCLVAPAMADTRAGVDLSVSGKVATDPFLETTHSTGVAGSLRVDPWIQFIGDQSRVDLRGDFSGDAYTQNYGTDASADVRLNATKRLSPYVSINGGAGFRTAIVGAYNLVFTSSTSANQVQSPTTPLPDVSFSGRRTRTKTFDANVGFDLKPSPLDTLNVYFGAAASRFNSLNQSDYNYYNAGMTYGRRLSAHTSLTASVLVARSDYVNTRTGDGTIVTPQLGIDHEFSPTLTFSISAGASLARTRRADGSTDDFKAFSGQIRLCNRSERSTLCLNGSRIAQPTALGVSAVTSVAVSYDNQVSRKDTVTVSAQYSRNDSSTAVQAGTSQLYGVSGSATHNFNRRFSAFIAPSFSKISGNVSSHQSNFQAEVGVRFRFGAIS